MITPFEVKDGIRVFDFKKSLLYLEQMGQKKYGDQFKIYKEDRKLIYKLLIYAIGDIESCRKHKIDPDKGILLNGPIGSGKTSLMNLIKYFMPPNRGYMVKPARQVAFEFDTYGFEIIQRHSQYKTIYCFDDLGVEQTVQHYGNKCNVMAEVLLSRYDLFVGTGIQTHATTNLNAKELENLYGNRVRSRMKKMFNLIAFDAEVRDKR